MERKEEVLWLKGNRKFRYSTAEKEANLVASSRISFPLFQDFVYIPITNTSEIIK